jgi:hypothetical protein
MIFEFELQDLITNKKLGMIDCSNNYYFKNVAAVFLKKTQLI